MMKAALAILIGVSILWPPALQSQATASTRGPVRVSIVRMPFTGERNAPELSPSPDALLAGGLVAALDEMGARPKLAAAVRLSPAEERQYGAWQRLALANGHLAQLVSADVRSGDLSVGLLANCSSLLGMLAGVQTAGRSGRAGLVYIDAHADFNTPETTLSGMLGGMDVAVAAGLCLTRLRVTSGLETPLRPEEMLLAGVRDVDPLEKELLDKHRVPMVSAQDLRGRSAAFRKALAALAARTDRIYVHVDLDVLDPAEVPGHSLNVPGGPTSAELGDAIAEMFATHNAVALGIASTPTGDRDKDGRSQKAAYELIRAAVRGAQAKSAGRR
jgi:arginase